MRRGVAGVRLCHAAPCKYPAGRCPLHGLRVAFPGEGRLLTHERPIIEDAVKAVRHHYPDAAAFSCCGHSICSCPQKAPEPPKDVLPEGWMLIWGDATAGKVRHSSGAAAWAHDDLWKYRRPGHVFPVIDGIALSRSEAMAAALQSVEHAEPALREGWTPDAIRLRFKRRGHEDVVQLCSKPELWRVLNDSNHPTLEAALIRAEQLARGEPDDRDEPDGPDGYESAGAEFVANGGWSGL